jgi:hypothetical protein
MHCELDTDAEDVDSNTGSSSSSSRPQQPRSQRQQAAVRHVGKFGSLDVVPAEEMLPKPNLPGHGLGSSAHYSSADSSSSSSFRSQPLLPPLPGKGMVRGSKPKSSRSGGYSNSYSYTPLSGSSIVQQHQVASSEVQLVLGHARLAAAAAVTTGSSTGRSSTSPAPGSGGSISASLALPPPNRFGVAGLKAVGQLGLSGQPVMIVGWDVWARQRAVLCLKAGRLFLSAAAS